MDKRPSIRFGPAPKPSPGSALGTGGGLPKRKLGSRISPLQPEDVTATRAATPKAGVMSPQTKRGLEALMDVNKPTPEQPTEAPEAESPMEVDQPSEEPIKDSPELPEATEGAPEPMPEPVTEPPLTDAGMPLQNPRLSKERREAIESRCGDMKFEDLIINDEVRQIVPIFPDKLVVEFRTHFGTEEVFVKDYIYDSVQGKDSSGSRMLDLYAVCNLALCVVSINGEALPNHLDKERHVVKPQFQAKVDRIMRLSALLIADLSTNLQWFQERSQKLFNAEKLKNG